MSLPRPRLRRPSRRLAFALVPVAALGLALLVLRPFAPASAGPASATDPATPVFTGADGWTMTDLQTHLAAGDVSAVTATGTPGAGDGTLVARRADGSTVPVRLAVPVEEAARALAGLGYTDRLTQEALAAARAARAVPGTADPVRAIGSAAVPVLLLGVVLVLVWTAIRGRLPGIPGLRGRGRTPSFAVVLPQGRGERGAASGPAPVQGVRLADVAGCDEAKAELVEVIEFLRAPERFARLGATLPRGVLLYGPPGTGKTMLAKAVASEAGVAFISASGSEFVEKYVGVGARRVRELFAQARRAGRAVVFVDEFDALAKARGGPNGHEERETTLNQLLVELDGFAANENIVVIAATNRLDVLDAAVLRPGRFNRKIHVGLPDVRGRREILGVHARSKPLAEGVDLEALARKTYGFSGAQLADLLNEAAILAARRAADAIDGPDLQAGWLKVAVGTGRKRSMDGRERAIIAAHEVGHAICGRVHGDRRRVEEISLFAHGEALGVTVSSQEDNDLPSESDLRARLVALMGGRAAEELLFHEVTGGASNDFEKAMQIATSMVTRFGMGTDPDSPDPGISGRGALSLLVARQGGGLPSEVQPAATRAIRSILDRAYADACDTLAEHLPTLRRIAAYLVEEERVDGETFAALFEGTLEVPTADDEWRPEAARPRAWADVVPFRDQRLRRTVAPALVEDRSSEAAPTGDAPTRVPLAAAVAASVPGTAAASVPSPESPDGALGETTGMSLEPPATGSVAGPAASGRTIEGPGATGSPAAIEGRDATEDRAAPAIPVPGAAPSRGARESSRAGGLGGATPATPVGDSAAGADAGRMPAGG